MKRHSNHCKHPFDILTRRHFIKTAAACAVGGGALAGQSIQAGEEIPTRVLGKTGLKVSLLSFGGGSQFLKNPNGKWEPMLEHAVQSGINLFDTASTYQWSADQPSETRFGEILPAYRDRVLICTKFEPRDVEKAKQEFERSLRRLKTDYVDMLLIHAIKNSDSVSTLENGVYRFAHEMKEQGAARFIGISSMDSAARAGQVLRELDCDVALLALSPTEYGNYIKQTLPIAKKKNVGVLAMKVMRNVVNKAGKPAEILDYAWSLPGVSTALVGHYGMQTLEENIQLAKQARKSAVGDFERFYSMHGELRQRMAPYAGPHALCWARPGYTDFGRVC